MEDEPRQISDVGTADLYEARHMINSITVIFMVLAGVSLVVYSMTVPMPFGTGSEDDLVHNLALLMSGFFGGLAYLSSREDQ